jgi:glyoxylase-like metal-dependent hydrolase (beta-lactamase superfamily II)
VQRERVAEDIYVFASDLYAQVTATVIATSEGAVLFDTLLFPEEARLINGFVETRLGLRVCCVINSHFHADHTAGTCFFEGADVIAHARCRDLLDQRGRSSLEQAKTTSPEMRAAELILPDVVFEGSHTLQIGNKTLELWSTPGHSPDSIVCLVKEDRVLLGADTLLPLPHFVDGSFDDLLTSLEGLSGAQYENIIQGHGDVILRGEIDDKLRGDIAYLHALRAAVDSALHSPTPDQSLTAIGIESCGKSRVLLNGAADQLHRQNVYALANQRIIEA